MTLIDQKNMIEFDNTKLSQFKHSNKLIEAKYRLSLMQQRIIISLASMITPSDQGFKLYKIDIRKFAAQFDIKGESIISLFKESTEDLLRRPVVLESEKGTLQFNWISSAQYNNGESFVIIGVDPILQPYFLNLKEQYTLFMLDCFVQFKSYYSYRIYMLLKQYVKIGKRKFKVLELRKMLGIEDKEYKLYSDFRARSIQRAVTDINEYSDIVVSYQEIKIGRKVEEISFFIAEKGTVITESRQDENKTGNDDKKKLESRFETEFWPNCPLQKNKGKTKEIYQKIIGQNQELEDKIISAVKSYAKKVSDPKFDKKFIKHPNNWLRDENYCDSDLSNSEEKEITFDKKSAIQNVKIRLQNSFELKNNINAATWDDFRELEFDYEDQQAVIRAGDKKEFLAEKYSALLEKFGVKLT